MSVVDSLEQRPLIFVDDGRVSWHDFGDSKRGQLVVYVRGYAHDGTHSFENESLAVRIHALAAQGVQALSAEIPKLNGGWALVVAWPDRSVLAAVDRMRTVPLFFYHTRQILAIAGSAADLARQFSRPMSSHAQLKFLLFGYVPGSDTLYEGVQQLQPGEIATFRPGSDERCVMERYYRFYPPAQMPAAAEPELVDELAAVISQLFERFRDGYRGEQIAIPLSGGLDSRLIAGMLKRLGIENCLCYTYGNESDEEVRLSRQVADALGLRWRCFSHSPDILQRYNVADHFRDYLPFGCKGVASPVAHDFAAVVQLAQDGHGGRETIFFPGHSADMNAGSHIPPDFEDLYAGTLSVVDEIIRHHARPTWYEPAYLLNAPGATGIYTEIEQEAIPPEGVMRADPLACCEMWNAENRQSKYIINSVRIYEFVGARWRTLWDYEFMDFFLRVPTELRYGQRLYLETLRRKIFVDDLAPLAEIPIAKHGALKSLRSVRTPAKRSSVVSRLGSSLKRKARWQLLQAGLANPLADKEDPLIRTIIRLCGLETADGSVSFGEALERAGSLPHLSPEIRQALAPWLKMKLEAVPGFAIYTVLVLAEMSGDITYPKSSS